MRGRAEATSAGTEKKNAKDYAAETNSVDTIQRARRRTIGRASAISFAEERRWSGHQKLARLASGQIGGVKRSSALPHRHQSYAVPKGKARLP